MKPRIEDRWGALIPAPETPIFQLLDAEHPLSLYIGKSISGEFLFLIVDEEQPPDIASMRSVDIAASKRPDGRWNLLLTLRQTGLSEVFALLCEDLALSSRHLAPSLTGMQFVSRRLSAWRRLMEHGRNDLLTPAAARGLMGELLVLEAFLAAGMDPGKALAAWVGPLGADQDFQFPELAWEVKTTHPDAPTVQIASERQLHAKQRDLRLVLVTLLEVSSTGSRSLNQQVDHLRSLVQASAEALDLLDDRLKEAGYIARPSYAEPHYKAGQIEVFRVDGDFPRLGPSDLPDGVCELVYRVRTDALASFRIETPAWN